MQSQIKRTFIMRKNKNISPKPLFSENTFDNIAQDISNKLCNQLSDDKVNNLFLLCNNIGPENFANLLYNGDNKNKIINDFRDNIISNIQSTLNYRELPDGIVATKIRDSIANDFSIINDNIDNEDDDNIYRNNGDNTKNNNMDNKDNKEIKKSEKENIFTCLLCDDIFSAKQNLQIHYIKTCPNKSLMSIKKTPDFISTPLKFSDEYCKSIVKMLEDNCVEDYTNEIKIQKILSTLLHDLFFDNHIHNNNNIYITNKNYEISFYIITNGLWNKSGTIFILRNRVKHIFRKISVDIWKQISSNKNSKKIFILWNEILRFFADDRILARIVNSLYYDIHDQRYILEKKYMSSFQHSMKQRATKE